MRILTRGRIDRSQLIPVLSKEYNDQAVKTLAAQLASVGSIDAFIYKGSHRGTKGTTYVYLVHFDNANALASFTLDTSGHFSALDISPG